MMNVVKVLAGCALVVSLVACNRGEPVNAPSEEAIVENAAPEVVGDAPAAPAEATPSTLVAGKVPLKFPHSVRANLQSTENGATSHTLRVEYKEIDEAAVAAAIVSAFEAEGYVVKTDGIKSVAISDAGKVRYTIVPVGPNLKVELSSPESKGLVTFIW